VSVLVIAILYTNDWRCVSVLSSTCMQTQIVALYGLSILYDIYVISPVISTSTSSLFFYFFSIFKTAGKSTFLRRLRLLSVNCKLQKTILFNTNKEQRDVKKNPEYKLVYILCVIFLLGFVEILDNICCKI
jgi:hypothetical protein